MRRSRSVRRKSVRKRKSVRRNVKRSVRRNVKRSVGNIRRNTKQKTNSNTRNKRRKTRRKGGAPNPSANALINRRVAPTVGVIDTIKLVAKQYREGRKDKEAEKKSKELEREKEYKIDSLKETILYRIMKAVEKEYFSGEQEFLPYDKSYTKEEEEAQDQLRESIFKGEKSDRNDALKKLMAERNLNYNSGIPKRSTQHPSGNKAIDIMPDDTGHKEILIYVAKQEVVSGSLEAKCIDAIQRETPAKLKNILPHPALDCYDEFRAFFEPYLIIDYSLI